MTNLIKAIIFDLGGVILKHRHDLMSHIISRLFSMPETEAGNLWNQYRIRLFKGEMSSEQFIEDAQRSIKTKYSPAELLKLWKDLYAENAGIDRGVLELIGMLRQKFEVYLLTDIIDIHDEHNKTRGIYGNFTKVFKSTEEKSAKAEGKAAYLGVLKKINAKPEECVFIDDSEEYVKVAGSLGIKGIVFNGLPRLKEKLNELGVIVNHINL